MRALAFIRDALRHVGGPGWETVLRLGPELLPWDDGAVTLLFRKSARLVGAFRVRVYGRLAGQRFVITRRSLLGAQEAAATVHRLTNRGLGPDALQFHSDTDKNRGAWTKVYVPLSILLDLAPEVDTGDEDEPSPPSE